MTIWTTLLILSVAFIFVNCAEKELSTCFHHFGCVNFTHEWFNNKLRPHNLEPLNPHIVNVRFLLLSAASDSNTICYDPIISNPLNINITVYENHRALMVLIHDFTSNGYTGWIKHVTWQLTAQDRYNVISVDWQEGAEPPFLQAVSNARVVAIEIQQLLNTLVTDFCLILSEVHLVGHGVGAHIAGYVGKALNGQIGRITGLDPTGPLFEGMPPVVRLHYNDAIYVEVLHTDGEGEHHQGTMQPMGNMDFYFNHGHTQPGCRNLVAGTGLLSVTRDQLKAGTVLPGCSHKRAFKYYITALQDSSCRFLALPLGTAQNMPLNCEHSPKDKVLCATVGLDIDTKHYTRQVHAQYEITTGSCEPFCTNRYQIEIGFASCPEAEAEATGYFNVVMFGEEDAKVNLTFNKAHNGSQAIQRCKNLTFSAWTSDPPVEPVQHVLVTWHFTTPFCYFCRNATCVHHVSVTQVRSFVSFIGAPFTSHFCPPEKHKYTVLYDHKPNNHFVKC